MKEGLVKKSVALFIEDYFQPDLESKAELFIVEMRRGVTAIQLPQLFLEPMEIEQVVPTKEDLREKLAKLNYAIKLTESGRFDVEEEKPTGKTDLKNNGLTLLSNEKRLHPPYIKTLDVLTMDFH